MLSPYFAGEESEFQRGQQLAQGHTAQASGFRAWAPHHSDPGLCRDIEALALVALRLAGGQSAPSVAPLLAHPSWAVENTSFTPQQTFGEQPLGARDGARPADSGEIAKAQFLPSGVDIPVGRPMFIK